MNKQMCFNMCIVHMWVFVLSVQRAKFACSSATWHCTEKTKGMLRWLYPCHCQVHHVRVCWRVFFLSLPLPRRRTFFFLSHCCFLQRASRCARLFPHEFESSGIFLTFVACPALSELSTCVPLHEAILSASERLHFGSFGVSSFTAISSRLALFVLALVHLVFILRSVIERRGGVPYAGAPGGTPGQRRGTEANTAPTTLEKCTQKN